DLHSVDKVQVNGEDIAFVNATGTKLDHELELFDQTYNTTHAHLITWVKVPSLSGTLNTTISMYYGNKAISNHENIESVWNDNYEGVWHLSESSGSGSYIRDSTNNNHDGDPIGTEFLETGMIGAARNFPGTAGDHYIEMNGSGILDGDGAFTFSFWLYPNYSSDFEWEQSGEGRVFHKESSANLPRIWRWDFQTAGKGILQVDLRFETYGTSYANVEIYRQQWNHVTYSYNGSYLNTYVNGLLEDEDNIGSDSLISDSDFFSLGLYTNSFTGFLDEFRYCTIGKTTNWIVTEYTNQNDPKNFYIVENEEEYRYWFRDASFEYKKDLVIDNTKVSQDLTNFPVLVDITDSALKTGRVQPDGDDILFIDANGTKLAHEIENFTQSSSDGHLVAWVNIPKVLATEDTVISMYYGNNEVSKQTNPSGVWNNNYLGIWHLGESSGDALDSTIYGTDGVITGVTQQAAGQIGYGYDFDGNTDYINMGDPADGHLDFTDNEDFTLSFWVYIDSVDDWDGTWLVAKRNGLGSSYQGYSIKLGEGGDDYPFHWGVSSNGPQFGVYASEDNLIGSWHYVACVFDENSNILSTIYDNGTDDKSTTFGDTNDFDGVQNSFNFIVGGDYSGGDEWHNGRMDEIRISSTTRSADWIATEYANQLNPTEFYSIGPETLFDKIPPLINDFGVDDPGTGIGRFWADITDSTSDVESVTIEVNDTEYGMSFNGTYWIYQKSVNFLANYEYQIINASDNRGNFITSPSSIKNHTFNYDSITPNVDDWDYDPDTGEYGTFNTNVSDSWGVIDTVIVNVTYGTVPQGERWAVMQSSAAGYTNDTIIMDSGSIKFVISVNDSAGNSFTSGEHQGYVPIVNHFPIAENLTMSRDSGLVLLPIYSNCTLYLDYDFYDQDDDSEGGTEIRWYKNGILQTAYNDLKEIPDSALVKSDSWNATVKPKDGQDFGTINSTQIIIIQNTAPTVVNVVISPGNPSTTSTLSVSYTYGDYDSDSENTGNREIRWYKNEALQTDYNDQTSIPSLITNKSESWKYEIRVYDGEDYSSWVTSTITTIDNTAPTALDLAVTTNPQTSDDLIASWSYTDADGDSESTSWIIRWYKNGGLESSLNDKKTVESGNTSKGEIWYFNLQVYDGENYSILYTLSPSFQILNTAPTASDLTITTTPQTGDNLQASWTFADVDSDSESSSWIIRWYEN
ncbi:MAG: DUF2341 domain-containing protein, partial [Candidatus Hodarchaeales archaeon]